jgi:hypothetical protein
MRRMGMDINNFQRIGSVSNAQVGRDFEEVARKYFEDQNVSLSVGYSLPIGVGEIKKGHSFDLGCNNPVNGKIVVECKSHTWTSGGNVPSAKITVWNEAMYYFSLAPKDYRKVFFILKDHSQKRKETLGEYYIRTYKHLIPNDVEIKEYDCVDHSVRTISE